MSSRIEVYYHERLVGEIATNRRDTMFQYDGTWLETGLQLSPKIMRLSSALYPGDPAFSHLPPLFADSLPDRYGQSIMQKWFIQNRGVGFIPTPLDRLAYVGETGMGALVYRPAAGFPAHLLRELDLRAQKKLSVAILGREAKEFVDQAKRAAGSVGGRFPKILCAEDTTTGKLFEDDPRLERGYRHWIIKFAQKEDTIGPLVEYALSWLARAAGISVPEVRLFHSAPDQDEPTVHFGIERFDRAEAERIHAVTLSALLGRPISEGGLDYQDFLAFTFEISRDMRQVEEAFRRMVFNVAVHNTDDHAKNHSFLYRNAKWSLSPAYDLTFGPGSPGSPGTHEMSVAGQSSDIGYFAIAKVADAVGLSTRVCRKIVDRVTEIISTADSYFEEAGIGAEDRRRITTSIDQATRRLKIPPAKVKKSRATVSKPPAPSRRR